MNTIKRLLLILGILLLLAGQGWAATYYVSTTGSNTAPYDTPAKAANLPSTVAVYINTHAAANNTINIAAGTYTDAVNHALPLNNANHANLTIQGAGRTNTILNSTGGYTLYIADPVGDGVVINDLTLEITGSNDIFRDGGCSVSPTLNRVDIKSLSGHTGCLIRSIGQSPGKVILNACRLFWINSNSAAPIYFYNQTNNFDFNYCISQRIDDPANPIDTAAGNWELDAPGGTLNLNNSLVFDSMTHGIVVNDASWTATISNSIVQGGITNTAAYGIIKSAGTVVNNNCLVIGNPNIATQKTTSGCTDNAKTQTLYSVNPLFNGSVRGGFIIPCVDDGANFDYAGRLAGKLNTYGMKGSYFTPITSATTAANLRVLVGGGTLSTSTVVPAGIMEVACHGYSHTPLTYAHALKFVYGGAGTNPTVAFDGTTITCNSDGDTDKQTYAIAGHTLGQVIAALTAHNWTVTLSNTDAQNTTLMNTGTLATSLKIQVATPAPCDIDFDNGAGGQFFIDEITTPKTTLATMIGAITDPQTGVAYACNSFAPPYDGTNTNALAETRAAGYTSGRSLQAITYPSLAAIASILDTYQLFVRPASVKGADDATTAANARALGFAAAQSGLVVCVLAHNDTDYTMADWDIILTEWKKIPGLTVTSEQIAANTIKTGGLWTDAGSGIFTRNYDVSTANNYKLNPGSPCVRGGTSVSLTTDYFSASVHTTPNIGIDDTQLSGGGLGTGLGLTGANHRPQ